MIITPIHSPKESYDLRERKATAKAVRVLVNQSMPKGSKVHQLSSSFIVLHAYLEVKNKDRQEAEKLDDRVQSRANRRIKAFHEKL